MDSNEIIWRPDPEAAARTRIAPLHGEARHLHAGGPAAPLGRGPRVVLGRRLARPGLAVVHAVPARSLDLSRGIQWPSWFPGGRMNLAANCIDRHLGGGPRATSPR